MSKHKKMRGTKTDEKEKVGRSNKLGNILSTFFSAPPFLRLCTDRTKLIELILKHYREKEKMGWVEGERHKGISAHFRGS